MSKIEDLERKLAEYWKKTEKERKRTHTGVLCEQFLKNENELK